MIEYYKYSAPLALGTKNIDSNDLLFAQSSLLIGHPLFVIRILVRKTCNLTLR